GDVRIEAEREKITCQACWAVYRMQGSVPVMLPDPGGEIRREGAPPANPYAPGSLELIERFEGGLVLDDGAGADKQAFPHVVQLEMYLSSSTDVVGDGLHLPFRNGSFDAVVSEAVLEHVTDPRRYISEIHRVLKEDGEVRIDAAFMSSFHAVPNHFFNVTRPGLELLLSAFEKIQSGVGPHQEPWVTLREILGVFEESLQSDALRDTFRGLTIGDLLQRLREQKDLTLFRSLRPEKLEYISAGVFFHGMKSKGAAPVGSKRPTVSVVVLHSENDEGLRECVERILDQRYPMECVDVVVVDRSGRQEPALPGNHRVRTVRSRPRRGIPAARMEGAREVSGKYVAFLDSNCRIEADWIDGLLEPIDETSKIVCSTSCLFGPEGKLIPPVPGAMDFLGRPLPEVPKGMTGEGLRPSGPALFPFGGGMLIDREVFFQAGGFDAEFHACLDDLDLGWRLWVLGYEVRHAPASPVQLRTSRKLDMAQRVRRVVWEERGALTALYKNYDEANLNRILPLAILLTLERGWGSSEISPESYRFGSPDDDGDRMEKITPLHAAHLLATDRFLGGLEQAQAGRRRIQARRARSDEEILSLFSIGSEPSGDGDEYEDTRRALVEAFGLDEILAGAVEGRR
ncbi:MAG: glycosyltransferase, partial [Planctomycetota bacterium]|nr:glycosyltransferase [Planctomycetota bacterium]